MSLIALLLTIVAALLLSDLMDAFPGILWGWIHWPRWALWISLLTLFAWCLQEQNAEQPSKKASCYGHNATL